MWKAEPKAPLRKRFALLVAAAALVWLGVMLVGGDSGVLAIFRAKSKLDLLEERVRALEAENRRLAAEIRELGRDPRAAERIAREQLSMARPDEVVILVPDAKTLAAARQPSIAARDAKR